MAKNVRLGEVEEEDVVGIDFAFVLHGSSRITLGCAGPWKSVVAMVVHCALSWGGAAGGAAVATVAASYARIRDYCDPGEH